MSSNIIFSQNHKKIDLSNLVYWLPNRLTLGLLHKGKTCHLGMFHYSVMSAGQLSSLPRVEVDRVLLVQHPLQRGTHRQRLHDDPLNSHILPGSTSLPASPLRQNTDLSQGELAGRHPGVSSISVQTVHHS